MSKCAKWHVAVLILCMLGGLSAGAQSAGAGETAEVQGASPLSSALLNHAQIEVARIKALVDEGTLPKIRMDEAEAKLADAQDEVILSETLYGTVRLQDMSREQAEGMVAAAQRRVDRQSRITADREKLLDAGIIARSEFSSYQEELDSRERVLVLVQNRAKLLIELQQMAETEQRFEHAAQAPRDVLIRYDGNGLFSLGDLPTISGEFEKRFHHALPVSALGQTLMHQSMGL